MTKDRVDDAKRWIRDLRQEQGSTARDDVKAMKLRNEFTKTIDIQNAAVVLSRAEATLSAQIQVHARTLQLYEQSLIDQRRGLQAGSHWLVAAELIANKVTVLLVQVQYEVGDFAEDELRKIMAEPLLHKALHHTFTTALLNYHTGVRGVEEESARQDYDRNYAANLLLKAHLLTKAILKE